MPDLRYPIGPFVPDSAPTPQSRGLHIAQFEGMPVRMRRLVTYLSPEQLDTPTGMAAGPYASLSITSRTAT